MSSHDIGVSSSKKFEAYRLRALGDRYMESGDHSKELDQLKKLHELEPSDIGVLIAMADCYLNLQMHSDWFLVVKVIRDKMLEKPSRRLAQDLILEAEECFEAGGRLASATFLWCACCIHISDTTSALATEGVVECMDKLTDITWSATFLSKKDAKDWPDLFISVFLLLLEDLEIRIRSMKSADGGCLTKVLIRCLSNKARCLIDLRRIKEAFDLSKKCFGEIEKQYGSYANQLAVFCEFLCYTGLCYAEKNKIEESYCFFNRTLAAAEKSRPTTDGEKARGECLVNAVMRILNIEREASRPCDLGLLLACFRD